MSLIITTRYIPYSQRSEYIFISLHPQSVPELLPPVLLREAFGGQQTSRSSLLCCVCISSSCTSPDGRTRDDTANTSSTITAEQPQMNVTSQKLTQTGLTVQWLLQCVADVQLSRDSSSLRPGNSCAFMSASKPH